MTELLPVTFGPHFKSADVRERLESENYVAIWLENIVTPRKNCTAEYAFIIVVMPKGQSDPVLFLTSEINARYWDKRKKKSSCDDLGSHYLGLFDAGCHYNLGASNAWGDPQHFRTEAVSIIATQTGELLQSVSDNADTGWPPPNA